MDRLRSVLRSERGFTVTELVAVAALLAVVVGVAYAAIGVVDQGSKLADRQSTFATDISYPLQYLSKLMMQNAQIETATVDGYGATFLTDIDSDDDHERNIVTLTGGNLELDVWNTDDGGYNTTPRRSHVLFTTSNSNRSRNQPVFRYFDQNGNEITNYASVPASATACSITLMGVYQSRVISDTVSVNFRNKSGG